MISARSHSGNRRLRHKRQPPSFFKIFVARNVVNLKFGSSDQLNFLSDILVSLGLTVAELLLPGRGRGNPTAASTAQRGNSRAQSSCAYCRQTGHLPNDCPSQASRGHTARSLEVDLQNGEPSIPCNSCGAPCILRTANTTNNRGRKFFSCQSQECNFFVWEDNLNGGRPERANTSASTSSGRGGRGRGRGRGTSRAGAHPSSVSFLSATGEPINGRCFICGDPGHFANICPRRG
ncbi:DNA topoisomerase 3-alpha [Datura stramonium]|uniref:DNA topoisomerase 3-alpha n=1 Tax=Datura stramonium TaxID=4076 RepID=A0ABS8TN33_DATST|nr:DNA topoisomerase 3-alpha [Datura stramonium]